MKAANMYFVYSLLIDGRVFYIGKCKNLASRYSAHLRRAQRGYADHLLSEYIRELLALGKCPLIKAIDYLPLKYALLKEKELIQSFTLAGHVLANSNLVKMAGYTPHKFNFPHTQKNVRKDARMQQKLIELNYR